MRPEPQLVPVSLTDETKAGGEKRQEKRVLIVDDEPAVRARLEEALAREGFQCEACLSGEQALQALARQSYDVVIADLTLPGTSGFELLDEGRQKYPQSAFLVAAVNDDLRVGIEAMKRGAADYLVKPLEVDSVVMSVERAVRLKQVELDLEKQRQDLTEIVEARTQELRQAIERTEQVHDEMMEMLGAALDARDDETAGHALRVTRYALEIGKTLRLCDDRLADLAEGSFLHDIGKIGIPDAILLKPGPLTPQERAVMQAHVEIGYGLIRRSASMSAAAEIVLTHHERFDGMGYPSGLKEEQIPLGGRIFAVADALDAMTSERPYRRALPFATARAEIVFESGRQFDPTAAGAFLDISEHVWQRIRQEAATHWGGGKHEVPKMSLIWQRWGRRRAG